MPGTFSSGTQMRGQDPGAADRGVSSNLQAIRDAAARKEKVNEGPPGLETSDHSNQLNPKFDWRTKFRTDIITMSEKWGRKFGFDPFQIDAAVRDNIDQAIGWITSQVPEIGRHIEFDEEEGIGRQVGGPSPGPLDPTTWGKIWDEGVTFYSRLFQVDLAGTSGSGSRGSGSGSAGPSGPTADEIRAMFDEDQLTDAATNIWQGWLVEEPKDARKMAKNYIQAVVDTGGEQEIDFETFITTRIKKNPRYDLMYQNKPDGVSEVQYIQPFVQSAASVMGASQGAKGIGDVVAGGAALGASSTAFRERLKRTDAHQNSQGFMTGMEDRIRSVNDVLRG